MEIYLYLTPLKKINSLWIKKLNMTSVILKLLQENQRIFLTLGKYFSFFKRLFIYLEDTVTETGEWQRKESEIFHLLVHFPNGCNSWDRGGLKPGAKNSIGFSHVGGRVKWAIISCFLGALAGFWVRSKVARTRITTQYGMWVSQTVAEPMVPQSVPPLLFLF